MALANERHHEYAILEHLLLALIDDKDAAAGRRAVQGIRDLLGLALLALSRRTALVPLLVSFLDYDEGPLVSVFDWDAG